MKRAKILLLISTFFPFFTFAASLQEDIKAILTFSNDIVLPFLLGIAFLFFIINIIHFAVIGGATEEGHDKAKSSAIYGVAAFVIIIVFWGVVNLLASSLGFAGESAPTPDYMEAYGGVKAKATTPTGGSAGNSASNSSKVTCILPPDSHTARLTLDDCSAQGGVGY